MNNKTQALWQCRESAGSTRTSKRSNAGSLYNRAGTGNAEYNRLKDEENLAKEQLNEAEELLRNLQQELDEKTIKLDEWRSQHTMQTEQDFFDHALNRIIQSGIDKYHSLFYEPRGDHFEMLKAMKACRIFNPFFIKEASTQEMRLLVDELRFFGEGYADVFQDDDFLKKMKEEIPTVKHLVTSRDFDWNTKEASSQYEKRASRRKIREQKRISLVQNDGLEIAETGIEGRVHEADNWKDDPGEFARRIYSWWQAMNKLDSKDITYFVKALVLIVLVQPSSCSVERIFSQLQFIQRACGPKMIESTLELRTKLRYDRAKQNEDEYEF